MKKQEDLSHIRCSKNSNATHSCLNKNCQKYAFVCQSEECQCHRQHEFCLMVKIGTIVKSCQGKILSTKNIESCLESNVDKLIDKLSEFRDKILNDMKTRLQLLELSLSQKILLSQLKEGNTQEITGAQIWQAHIDLVKQEQIATKMAQIIENMNTNFISLNNQTEKHCDQIHKIISQLQTSSQTLLLWLNKKYISKPNMLFFGDQIPVPSKIICSKEESQTMSNFFEKKQQNPQNYYTGLQKMILILSNFIRNVITQRIHLHFVRQSSAVKLEVILQFHGKFNLKLTQETIQESPLYFLSPTKTNSFFMIKIKLFVTITIKAVVLHSEAVLFLEIMMISLFAKSQTKTNILLVTQIQTTQTTNTRKMRKNQQKNSMEIQKAHSVSRQKSGKYGWYSSKIEIGKSVIQI